MGACRSRPTWSADVAPILEKNCLGCHATGMAPGPRFATYEEAAQFAGRIELAVQTRRMPPWLADNTGACSKWKDALWLSDGDIRKLVAWAESGTARGEAAARDWLPRRDPSLKRVDAALDTGTEYVPGLGSRSYRCFVSDPRLARDGLLTAFRVVSTDPRGVAQIGLYDLDSEDAARAAARLDAGEPGPGYTCYGGARVLGARLVASWTRDSPLMRFPAGVGVRLKAQRPMVMQIHYDLTAPGLGYRSRTRIELELDDRAREATAFPVRAGGVLEPGQQQVERNATVPLPSGSVVGVAPRMHTLGIAMRVDLLRAGTRSCLASFDHWSFYWQRSFFSEEPAAVGPGDAAQIRCIYDTRMRSDAVRDGEDIEEEECLAVIYLAP